MSRYLAQLRILAASYSTFSSDLKRQMVRSAFLLASHRVMHLSRREEKHAPSGSVKGNATEDDDDTSVLLEYDLAKPKEVRLDDFRE